MMKSRFAFTTVAILLAGTVAQATTLGGIQGTVLVNTGQGYQAAQVGDEPQAGRFGHG